MSQDDTYTGTKIDTLEFREHVLDKSMWTGASDSMKHEIFVVDNGEIIKTKIEYSDSLYKIVDEIIVNAIDQYIRTAYTKDNPVTKIEVTFDKKTGEITVKNDGNGMPVYYSKKLGDMYSVQAIISQQFTGSNFDDDNDPYRVTGGTNGLGIKLVNIYSKKFQVETIDKSSGLYYLQTCTDNMSIVNKPTVKKTKARPYTRVSFIPDYDNLCKTGTKRKWFNAKRADGLEKLFRIRCYQMAAFIASVKYRTLSDKTVVNYSRPAKVIFNGTHINIKSLKDLAKIIPDCYSVSHVCKGPKVEFPWEICVIASEMNYSLNLVNGVVLSEGGSHINYLQRLLGDALRTKIGKLLNVKDIKSKKPDSIWNSYLQNRIFLVNSIQIPNPQFTSQTKDKLSIGKAQLNKFKETYKIPTSFYNKVWKILEPILELDFIAKKKKTSKKNFVNKCNPAHNAGKANKAHKCSLFIPEGDSASSTIKDIITSKSANLGFAWNGMYNIQGVPMNSIKSSQEKIVRGTKYITQNASLKEHKALQGLYQVLGLDYSYTYKSDKEFKTLRYGRVIVAVDQDVDGVGQIFSLILVYFGRFFPELIKRGYIYRFATPIIRAYPSSRRTKVQEFYSESEFSKWRIKTFGDKLIGLAPGQLPPKAGWTIKYYKGLATHSTAEVEHMAKNFHANLIRYVWDKSANEIMHKFYGTDSDLRKVELRKGAGELKTKESKDSLEITCSDHFSVESRKYQHEASGRKLPNYIDGLIPSQRKSFAGSRKVWASSNKEMKTFQICGFIAQKMAYHHGDKSLSDTITKMAQTFPGSCWLPLFCGVSNESGFGNISEGRGHTASARYTEIKLNKKLTDLLFPKEDDWLLEYVWEDGEMCEPEYYVPIIPYSILNTYTTTGPGWNISSYARDLKAVLLSLRNMINWDYTPENKISHPMSFFGQPWLAEDMSVRIGKFSNSSGIVEICFGKYEIIKANNDKDDDHIHVTQMPLKKWTYPFKCGVLGVEPYKECNEKTNNKKNMVKKINDNTGKQGVDMDIILDNGSIDLINQDYGRGVLSPVEDYLELYNRLDCNINMFGEHGLVVEFDSHVDIIKRWFPIRRKLYVLRLERRIILLKLRISLNESMLRFITMDCDGDISIDKIPEEEQVKLLIKHKFKMFNHTLLAAPGYIKNDELYDIIMQTGNYDYILNITKRMTSQEYIAKIASLIDKLKAELREAESLTWKSLWKSELDILEKNIYDGLQTNWKYKNDEYKF